MGGLRAKPTIQRRQPALALCVWAARAQSYGTCHARTEVPGLRPPEPRHSGDWLLVAADLWRVPACVAATRFGAVQAANVERGAGFPGRPWFNA